MKASTVFMVTVTSVSAVFGVASIFGLVSGYAGGDGSKVRAYSNGALVYEGVSNGAVHRSNGKLLSYHFADRCSKSGNKLVDVGGDVVVITHGDTTCPSAPNP